MRSCSAGSIPRGRRLVPEPLVPETIPRLPEAALWDPRTSAALIVGFDEIVHTATGRRRALVKQLGRPAISLDGRLVATAGNDQPIRTLDAQQLDTLDEIPIEGRFAAASVFSPDGRFLAVTVHNRAHVQPRMTPHRQLARHAGSKATSISTGQRSSIAGTTSPLK